jgi:hypothetical protein
MHTKSKIVEPDKNLQKQKWFDDSQKQSAALAIARTADCFKVLGCILAAGAGKPARSARISI